MTCIDSVVHVPITTFFLLQVRHIISDFAVFIAVIVWVLIDILADVNTPKLIVPEIFSVGFYSNPDRGFVINPLGELIYVNIKARQMESLRPTAVCSLYILYGCGVLGPGFLPFFSSSATTLALCAILVYVHVHI